MKNLTRRYVVKSALYAGAGIAGTSLFGCAGEGEPMVKNIGVQLYTIRDLMEKSVEDTLATVSGIGYKEVEFAGYFDVSASRMKTLLDQNGLTSPSTHISLTQARDDIDALIDYAQTVGHQYIIIGFLEPAERTTLDDYKRAIEIFNGADEKCRDAGIRFGYHHYDFEFPEIDGVVPYDMMLAQTDMVMQVDLFWEMKAGVDMSKYYNQYPGRFPMVHIKDIDENGEYEDLGLGKIDFQELLMDGDTAGFKHYFVENGTPRNSLETIKVGFDFVSKL